MQSKDSFLLPALRHPQTLAGGVREKDKPKKFPQTFQGQKENRERSLCHGLPCLEVERQENGGCESILQIKAVRKRERERISWELNQPDEEHQPQQHHENRRRLWNLKLNLRYPRVPPRGPIERSTQSKWFLIYRIAKLLAMITSVKLSRTF